MSTDTYSVSADVYDAIYTVGQQKDYELEARHVRHIAEARIGRRPIDMSLFDVACGTGLHLLHFKKWFKHVEGLDISEAMLSVARKRLPEVKFHQGSMTSILLNPRELDHEPRFDVVTCLFSAIGHLTELNMLVGAVREMADHVQPGGVLIIEPWLMPEMFDPAKGDGAVLVDEPDLKIARFAATTRNALVANTRQVLVTRLRLDYMVKRSGQPVATFVEEHTIAMWTEDDFRRAFRDTGMEVIFDPKGLSSNGRGVYIATKPS